MSENHNEDFFKSKSATFGTFDPSKDDYLHPELTHPADTCTETQYFGFYVPEADIYGFSYFWLKPNMQSIMGGVLVAQGFKSHHLQSELFDFHQNIHARSALKDDLRSYTLPNSYGVDVLDPGKHLRLRYDDPKLKNRINLDITAAGPVAMRANNKHFEQAMKYEGELVLRGKTYKVDCCNVRDRSWGEPRPEVTLDFPPLTWTTGCFGPDFAFNCSAFDHPDMNPVSLKDFPITAEKAFNDGWIWRNGEQVKIKSIKKLTLRDPVTARPLSHDIHAVDVNGHEYHIKGTITAALPFSFWPNCMTHLCMTKWECEGLIGWGDTQEVQWSEYMRKFSKAS